jgi:hypothetical protein
MLWLGCFLLGWIATLLTYVVFKQKKNGYYQSEILWYDGPTMEEFEEEQQNLYPEIHYEILRQKFECGDMTKEEFELAIKNITDKIDLKI